MANRLHPGFRVGMLVLTSVAGRTANRKIIWGAKCDCGDVVLVSADAACSGTTTSCGCLRRELVRAANRERAKHWRSSGPEYKTWIGMRRRCHDPADKDFARYGAAGLWVCDEWRQDFSAFFAHVGPRPQGTTLDRIDGRRGYEPGNVRWATASEQARNRKSTVWVDLEGVKMPACDAAKLLGVTPCAVYRQIKRKGNLNGYHPRGAREAKR